MEREAIVSMKGNPLTLKGNVVSVGDAAPEVTLVDNGLAEVGLGGFKGSVLILSVVPSLDTGVCAIQTRRFNEEATSLPGVKVLTVSMDLPFAQKRWADENEVTNLQTLSDHRDAAFGMAYGLLIKELRLLARAVLVVDASGVVRYLELVPEVTDEPNYDAALAAAKSLA